jgi:hypothetical protein
VSPKKTDLANRMALVTDRAPRRDGSEEGKVTASKKPAPRTRAVRITADLAPLSYDRLVDYSRDVARQLGRTRVSQVEVIRALLAELDDNPDLRKAVADRIQTEQ